MLIVWRLSKASVVVVRLLLLREGGFARRIQLSLLLAVLDVYLQLGSEGNFNLVVLCLRGPLSTGHPIVVVLKIVVFTLRHVLLIVTAVNLGQLDGFHGRFGAQFRILIMLVIHSSYCIAFVDGNGKQVD